MKRILSASVMGCLGFILVLAWSVFGAMMEPEIAIILAGISAIGFGVLGWKGAPHV